MPENCARFCAIWMSTAATCPKAFCASKPMSASRRAADTELRERTEIKNLNSIRNMVKAIDFEAQRQIRLYQDGGTVKPATLGWDETSQRITIQRYKERADEYRYFPEPDLPIVEVSREWVAEIRAKLPALPDQLQQLYVAELGLSEYDAGVLTAERAVAEYFQQMIANGSEAKSAANWITSDLFRLMNANEMERESIGATPVSAPAFAELLALVKEGVINQSTARKTVLPDMWETGKDARSIVDEQGLAQVSDSSLDRGSS